MAADIGSCLRAGVLHMKAALLCSMCVQVELAAIFLAMLFVLTVPLLASAQVCWWACWRWARGCRQRARWARRGCWPGRCSSPACLRSPAGKVGGQLLTGPFSPACNGRYMHAVVRLPAGSKSGATGLDGPFEH